MLADSNPPKSSPLFGVLIGTATLLALVVVRLAIGEVVDRSTPFLLQFVAVLLAAWYGGFGAGALITACSAALGYLQYVGEPSIVHPRATAYSLVFTGEALAVSWLAARFARERWNALRAARTAEEATERLEVVLRGVTDGITLQDERGQLIYANDAAARLCGFDSAAALLSAGRGDIMGRFELCDAAGAPLPLERMPGRKLLAGERPEELVVRYRARGATEHHWSVVNANPVFGAQGKLAYVVNVFRDVTAQRRHDEALRVSREWFSTALRSIGDAVITTNAEGRVTFMNPVAEKLTGCSAVEAEGRPLGEVFSVADPETREPLELPIDTLRRGAGNGAGSAASRQALLLRRDGGQLVIADSAAPIHSGSGELVGWVLIFRDVTAERREAERREFLARATLELSASLDYARTLSTVARLAVPRIADWCTVDIVENGVRRRLAAMHVDPAKLELVHQMDRRYPTDPEATYGVARVLRFGKPELIARIHPALVESVARDPEHLAMLRKLDLHSYLCVPMVHGGRIIGALTLAMAESKREYDTKDVELATSLADRAAVAVENARLFQSAELARSEAVLANRAKDDFLAILGHELRNPLAPILTALELMTEQSGVQSSRHRAVIERQVRHLMRLVDDLLDVSRILRGGVTLAREPVDVEEVVRRAIELASPLLEERCHRLHVQVPSDLRITSDGVRLTQVLTNLLTNAAKYTEPRGRIEVRVDTTPSTITFTVRDTGMGIAPDMLPRVFDMFVQAPQALDRAQGGLGLGLTIVKNLVRLFGGSISVHSAGPGLGSEFVVELPNEASGKAEPEPEQPKTGSARPSVRVLVVDDNEDALEMMVEALQMLGHEPHGATDAAAALEVAARVHPTLALLDIGLPVMDGYELGRRLRDLATKAPKLVAVTGYGHSSDKERSREAGFDLHLVKPVDLTQIQDALAKLVG